MPDERSAMLSRFKLLPAGAALAAALAAAAGADLLLNDGRLANIVTDRAGLESACLSELKKRLADRGFAPNDIEFGRKPGLGFTYGQNRTFQSDFTFQDGAEAMRIDGIMACVVGKSEVRVDFRTAARPIRAT